jgi:hypothetical protein
MMHTYKHSEHNTEELIEFISGTSMPTGRIFVKTTETNFPFNTPKVSLRDPVTNEFVTYVYSHNT